MLISPKHQINGHFTASAMVFCRGHLLLVHHRRLQAWVPPGGHVEPNELPHEAALREVKEETGMSVSIIADPQPVTNDADAFFMPMPLYFQSVLAKENGQDFYHYDLAYLCTLALPNKEELPAPTGNKEVHDCQWFPYTNLSSLKLAKNVINAVELSLDRIKQTNLLHLLG